MGVVAVAQRLHESISLSYILPIPITDIPEHDPKLPADHPHQFGHGMWLALPAKMSVVVVVGIQRENDLLISCRTRMGSK